MLNSIDRITWRNGFRLNGAPAVMEDIEDIFEGRRAAALSIWAQYEKLKEELREMSTALRLSWARNAWSTSDSSARSWKFLPLAACASWLKAVAIFPLI